MSGDALLLAAEMRAAEAAVIAAGTPSIDLMERAGAGAAAIIARRWTKRPVAVLCGPGANGGDGFVVARLLREAGWPVRVSLLGARDALKGDAAINAARWSGPVEAYTDVLSGAGLVVDALFGTGLSRPLEGEAAAMIDEARRSGAPVVAIDIPSGVDSDTGQVHGDALQAEVTVAFAARKPGHLLFPGHARSGEVVVVDIGVPVGAAQTRENGIQLWGSVFPNADWSTHKYRRGHAAVVSGPRLKTGAARLAATTALRVGAGLVTVFSPESAAGENAAHLTAVMIREIDGATEIAAALADKRFTAALIGPGAGAGDPTADAALAILASGAAAVIDADALTSFEARPAALFAALRRSDILTPHEGEFLRVFRDLDPSALGRLEAARRAAARAGCVVLLKGADTVVADPEGRAAINANAPPSLATAGSGDVLAGLATGLSAQGMPAFEAACAAVWMHGAAATAFGPGLVAEDLVGLMPAILRQINEGRRDARDGILSKGRRD
ncbi:MAG: NAD(P)H-hydrate dehydratase [Parvularculaceae bacterium]|nr:NAD(P)H-hydrate dehydratase [Parvularculaceae bacterium]